MGCAEASELPAAGRGLGAVPTTGHLPGRGLVHATDVSPSLTSEVSMYSMLLDAGTGAPWRIFRVGGDLVLLDAGTGAPLENIRGGE